jgi:hypothetical protein
MVKDMKNLIVIISILSTLFLISCFDNINQAIKYFHKHFYNLLNVKHLLFYIFKIYNLLFNLLCLY